MATKNHPLHAELLAGYREAPRLGFRDYVGMALPSLPVLEFGVAVGTSLRALAEAAPDRAVFGFDSFEGIPEPWNGMPAGEFRCEVPTDLPSNVQLVVGMFHETLPRWLLDHSGECAIVHVDCDLYGSTKCVFDHLGPRLREGTILLFDEMINYDGWEQHEYRAFSEFVRQHHWKWSVIGQHGEHQVGIRLDGKL